MYINLKVYFFSILLITCLFGRSASIKERFKTNESQIKPDESRKKSNESGQKT
jgi:hypothetical protein